MGVAWRENCGAFKNEARAECQFADGQQTFVAILICADLTSFVPTTP